MRGGTIAHLAGAALALALLEGGPRVTVNPVDEPSPPPRPVKPESPKPAEMDIPIPEYGARQRRRHAARENAKGNK